MDTYDGLNFLYNSDGIRIKKGNTRYYLNGNKILAQDNGNLLLFHYGADDISGFTYYLSDTNKQHYTYKKNAQGDIIGIYNADNIQICKYVYDAWGNQKIFIFNDEKFVAADDTEHYSTNSANYLTVANLNPFRYRGYYFDIETGLYYLNSRYYDPEIGRFINADDISILSQGKDFINGLNLYAYCFNNPINDFDKNGNWSWGRFWRGVAAVFTVVAVVAIATVAAVATAGAGLPVLGAAIGAVAASTAIGAISGGITSVLNNEDFAGGVLGGAIREFGTGVAMGIGILTGGATAGMITAGILGSIATNYLTGSLAYLVENKCNDRQVTWNGSMISGSLQAVTGMFAFLTANTIGMLKIYNVPQNGILSVLRQEGLKSMFTSSQFSNIIYSGVFKSILLLPISVIMREIQKRNQ